jgi:hypothetical protein
MAMGTRQAASGSGRPGARFRHWVTRDVTAMAKANTSAQDCIAAAEKRKRKKGFCCDALVSFRPCSSCWNGMEQQVLLSCEQAPCRTHYSFTLRRESKVLMGPTNLNQPQVLDSYTLSCSGAFHKLYSSTSKDGDVKMQN